MSFIEFLRIFEYFITNVGHGLGTVNDFHCYFVSVC